MPLASANVSIHAASCSVPRAWGVGVSWVSATGRPVARASAHRASPTFDSGQVASSMRPAALRPWFERVSRVIHDSPRFQADSPPVGARREAGVYRILRLEQPPVL